jgi:hypothetical protein
MYVLDRLRVYVSETHRDNLDGRHYYHYVQPMTVLVRNEGRTHVVTMGDNGLIWHPGPVYATNE